MLIEELSAMPSVGPGYLRALNPVRRTRVGTKAPDRMVRLTGHRSTPPEVAAYSGVCGFPLRDTLPATWLHVLTFPLQVRLMTAPDFPLPPLGLVHVGNELAQHRPVGIGELLTLSVRAGDLRGHRRGVLIDLLGKVRVGDELVWEGRSTYLARGADATELGGTISSKTDGLSSSKPGPEPGLSPLRPAGLWRLPADLGRRYAAVSGDVNPIHLHPLAAKAFGFPRAIAHGMWTAAHALAALDGRLPPAFTADIRFHKPVLLPSTVRFAAAAREDGFVAAVTDRSGEKLHLQLEIRGHLRLGYRPL